MVLRRVLTVHPHVHLPLSRLALCIDCDQCFELGLAACPACSSETWTPLAAFIGNRRRGLSNEVFARAVEQAA